MVLCMTGTAHADSLQGLIERLDRLEQENRELREEIDALEAQRAGQKETPPTAAAPESDSTRAGSVHVDSEYGYEILDPTTHINRKQRLMLDRRRDGTPSLRTVCTCTGRSPQSPTTSRATGTTSSDT